ncbi:ATPase AAA [Clostridia bacterium]|nr:ATPase AAA [Clostridia bacterium]
MLKSALEASGAVLIEGPKWCGKTRTAQERAQSALFMQDPDKTEAYLKAIDAKPSLLLRGKTPRLIDEWQMAPVLWDAVRYAVDQRGEAGQFILTGSAVPTDNAVMHTGTGRISRMLMRPMSLFESLESSGDISLKALFDGNANTDGFSALTIERLAFALTRGGWPASVGEKESVALRRVYDYVDAVINMDVSRVDGVEKSPARVRALMRSLARNVSTTANLATIKNDIAGNEETISENTIASYMNALRRIYVVEDLPAWNPAMRSKTALRTSPKRHFIDPSIATAVLRATPDSLLEDFHTFGLLFESLCVRDLRVYAAASDGEVFHYRDKSGLEADAIVHLKDGRWGAVEVKMGAREIETAAENLKVLREKINLDKMREPSFLMVLTGTEHAYRRADGVNVVPIGCLKN